MLVKLISKTSGEVVLFAEHARLLFDVIGKARTARGVFTTEQLPEAIDRLQRAVDAEKRAQREGAEPPRAKTAVPGTFDDEVEEEAPIGLAQRAYPVIQLMESTLRKKGFVLWEAAADF